MLVHKREKFGLTNNSNTFPLVLGALLSAIAMINNACTTTESNRSTIRIGYPAPTELSQFDPARVQLAQQYFVLENLYSTLIERDHSGAIQPGLASNFGWIEDEIFLEIPDNLKASDGLPLSITDVLYSFKRLLLLGTSTHGDLKNLICDGKSIKTIEDECDGIRIEKNRILLKPKVKTSSIFDQLATIDFAIIPERSTNKKTLSISDHSITSGRYSVESRGIDGRIVLKVNQHHPKFNSLNPEKAELIQTNGQSETSMDLFRTGKIDFISTLETNNVIQKLSEYVSENDASIHTTAKVRLELIHFTSRGMSLPPKRRWAIAKRIRDQYVRLKGNQRGIEETHQYFPEGGYGSLDNDALLNITQSLNNADPGELGDRLIVGAIKRNFDETSKLVQAALPKAKTAQLEILPEYVPSKLASSEDFPHVYIITMDTGFLELLPNIVNTVKSGFFGRSKEERATWLDQYLKEPSKLVRQKKLKNFHLLSLEDPVIVPMLRTPYAGVLRANWKGDFSDFFPNVPIWQITKK
jgi:hypothetical protein